MLRLMVFNQTMISQSFVFVAAIFFASLVSSGNSYRILAVFPTPCYSHQQVLRSVALTLNQRGHELVVVTPNPLNDSRLVNYTEIDISSARDLLADMNFFKYRTVKPFELITGSIDTSLGISEYILSHPDLRKLYAPDSNEKFDLLIVEMLYYSPVFLLAKRFDVPVIGITTLELSVNHKYIIGNPTLPSHGSTWELISGDSEPASFWQRLTNFILVWKYIFWYQTTFIPANEVIARKYFGNDFPDLYDLEKNVSLIFVNQPGPISHSKPNAAKIIEIGGGHISKEMKTLPKGLKKFLDEATNGFVYMSLGSTGKSSTLPKETLDAFISGLARLPYKVLWKFENDILPGKPENVHIMKWVPQQAVLAHPNIKVFVYQGGLQSTEEAVAYAVPLVGFPSFGDQEMQIRKLVSLGVALKLEITAVNGNELFEAISTVASDKSYKQKMLDLRSIVNDKPYNLLDNAAWWTEFVIRHRGAPHLHSETSDDPWYRRENMDIVAFISIGSAVVLSLALVIFYRLIKTIYAYGVTHDKPKLKVK